MKARLQPQQFLGAERICKVKIPPHALQTQRVCFIKLIGVLKWTDWEIRPEFTVVRAMFTAFSQLICSNLKRSLYALFRFRAFFLFFTYRYCSSASVSWQGAKIGTFSAGISKRNFPKRFLTGGTNKFLQYCNHRFLVKRMKAETIEQFQDFVVDLRSSVVVQRKLKECVGRIKGRRSNRCDEVAEWDGGKFVGNGEV